MSARQSQLKTDNGICASKSVGETCRQGKSGRLCSLNFQYVSANIAVDCKQVVAVLKVQPKLRFRSEQGFQPQGHVSGHRGLMPAKPLNPSSRHTQELRRRVGGHAVGGQELLNEDFARMYGTKIVLSHVHAVSDSPETQPDLGQPLSKQNKYETDRSLELSIAQVYPPPMVLACCPAGLASYSN